MNLLAEPIHAAIGEYRAAEHRLRFVQVQSGSEVPRADTFVPVAADVSDVAVLLGGDDEGNFHQLSGSRSGVCGASAAPSDAGASSPEHFVVER